MTSHGKQELDVQVEVKELEGGQVELHVTVPSEPVAKVRENVLREFSRRANIPGFRKGKAPRSLLERFVDPEILNEQIVDKLVGDAYDVAAKKASVDALDRPRIADAELNDEGALTFTATITRRPAIELGEYKGLQATRIITPVTDEQVQSELDRLRMRRARYTVMADDDPVAAGDLVVVDYDMIVDGGKIEDKSTTGYPLEIGSDQLFPEMNDALPGAKTGEVREFEVSYPETHPDATLAGKTATFKVTITAARRRTMPELDDEFAQQVSDLKTMEELRARVRENLEAIGKAMADDEVRNQLVRRVSEGAALTVPEALVGREVDSRIEEAEAELDRRGLTLTQHLRNIGQSFEDWRAEVEREARAAARRALVLDELGEREHIQVTDEELHEEMHRRAEIESISIEEVHKRYDDPATLNRLVTRFYQRKAIQFLLDHAEVKDEVVEPAPDDEGAGAITEAAPGEE